MKTKLTIKTVFGTVKFEHEDEDNSFKKTVTELLKKFKGELIKDTDLSWMDLSGVDFSNSKFDNSQFYNSQFYNSQFDNSQFYNSKFYNSKFYNSKFYNSKFYNSQFYNSKFYNSQFDNSQFYNSQFYNSQFDNSQFYNSQFYNSKFDNQSFESAKLNGGFELTKNDFFGRMIRQKNEVPFLKKELIAGRINGSSYQGNCCCFVGTIAKALKCDYSMLPNLKPDASSPTEKWFMSIKEGDTPENNNIAKLTLEWIEEFEMYLKG